MLSSEFKIQCSDTTCTNDLNQTDIRDKSLVAAVGVPDGSLYSILMAVKGIPADSVRNKLSLFYCYAKENGLRLFKSTVHSNEESYMLNLKNNRAFLDPCLMNIAALVFGLRIVLHVRQDGRLKEFYFGKKGNQKVIIGVRQGLFVLLKKREKQLSMRRKNKRSDSDTTQESFQFKTNNSSMDESRGGQMDSPKSKKLEQRQNHSASSSVKQRKKELFQDKIVHQSEQFLMGRLKFFNKTENYGFITDFQGNDIFLHGQDIVQQDIDMEQLNRMRHFCSILVCFKQLVYTGNDGKIHSKAVETSIQSIQY